MIRRLAILHGLLVLGACLVAGGVAAAGQGSFAWVLVAAALAAALLDSGGLPAA